MVAVTLNKKGLARVLDGSVGMSFVVDRFTIGIAGPVAHVRDYRYSREDINKTYQIWSISADGYEIIN